MNTIPETSGVYKITCTVTGKFYIGSTVNFCRRQKQHWNELRRNAHENPKLQRTFNKYGEETFIFEAIEFILPPFLPEREQYWLDKLKPFGNKGYNCNQSTQLTRLGMKASPETLEKLKISQRGKHGKGIPRAECYGYTHSPETREKMKNSHIGKKPKHPPPSFKGKTHTPEAKEQISFKATGRKMSTEAVAINKASKTAQMKTLIIVAPDGTEHLITGVKAFCAEHGLNCSNLMRVAKGEYSQHKGYKARFPEAED